MQVSNDKAVFTSMNLVFPELDTTRPYAWAHYFKVVLIAEILWIAIVYRTSRKVLLSVKPELVKPDIFVQKAPFLIARSVKTIFDDVS